MRKKNYNNKAVAYKIVMHHLLNEKEKKSRLRRWCIQKLYLSTMY